MKFEVEGIQNVERILDQITPKHARNLNRAVNYGIASEITKEAKSNIRSLGIEKTGNLRKSLKTKRVKSHPDKPISDVIFSSGKKEKYDGFYWRFVEFGTGAGKGSHKSGIIMDNAKPFLMPAVQKIKSNIEEIYEQQFTKKLAAQIKRELRKAAK